MFSGSAISQGEISGGGASATLEIHLIDTPAPSAAYGVMLANMNQVFAGAASTAHGVFTADSYFEPRPVSGSFSGALTTGYGEFSHTLGHVILNPSALTRQGQFIGTVGNRSGTFEGALATQHGVFLGDGRPHTFIGSAQTQQGQFVGTQTIQGIFAGTNGTRYGVMEGPPRDFVGYDTIYVMRKPKTITAFRSS
jgi:hypothetical protein